MNRRAFFTAITGTIAGLAFDPERALWVPGKKLISIPSAPIKIAAIFTVGDLITIGDWPEKYIVTGVTESTVDLKMTPEFLAKGRMQYGVGSFSNDGRCGTWRSLARKVPETKPAV
jgi:hypothetical protein